ncbi:L-rhamnose mutarotase [Micromonospora qiuiae]|uniref:L-rhamnose mutarotase n=1 Tax=Micromonospora qiuiae TaxID=502268 RepID=A0ABQ4JHK8_9ACTN|nr:L-rhamnose mutarotase [Micromonospora qiuiae]
MRRICFTLQVRPDRLGEYRRRHAAVWPDMLVALKRAGWHDYSLFLRERRTAGGLLPDRGPRRRAGGDGNDRGQRAMAGGMAPFFADLPAGRPDRGFRVLTEIFNLEEQLGEQQ